MSLSRARSEECPPWCYESGSTSRHQVTLVHRCFRLGGGGRGWAHVWLADKQSLTFKKVVIFVFSVRHRFSSSATLRICSKSNKVLVVMLFTHSAVPGLSPGRKTVVLFFLPYDAETGKLKRCSDSVKAWQPPVAEKVSPLLHRLSLAITRAATSRQRLWPAPGSPSLVKRWSTPVTSANAIGERRCRSWFDSWSFHWWRSSPSLPPPSLNR